MKRTTQAEVVQSIRNVINDLKREGIVGMGRANLYAVVPTRHLTGLTRSEYVKLFNAACDEIVSADRKRIGRLNFEILEQEIQAF